MYIESTWPRLTSLVAKYFFPDLIAKYNSSLISDRNNEKVSCQKILDKMELHGYQIGRTKVFLRAGQMAELDARRTEVRNKAARAVQSRFRTHAAREKFLVLRKTSISFQSFVRGKVLLVGIPSRNNAHYSDHIVY